jgi:choline dehydrogenase-like flavoprotein
MCTAHDPAAYIQALSIPSCCCPFEPFLQHIMFTSLAILGLLPAALAEVSAAPSREFDFVIVGGGTSGLVVANRLSEDPNVTVAVIEAGDSVFNNSNVTNIRGVLSNFGTAIDWAYETVPQVHAGNNSQTLNSGKALGGTSTINGMAYLRADKAQINAWSEVGNNITWDSLLPYFQRSEQLQPPGPGEVANGASYEPGAHGYDGPVSVGWVRGISPNNYTNLVNSTFQALGLPWNRDANAGDMRGFTYIPATFYPLTNIRADSARAYYYPVREARPNLVVYTNAFAERLTWSTTTQDSMPVANGVVFQTGGQESYVRAKKDVILSAGALRSPLILEQSGVGNPKVLEKAGIEAKVELPAVGERLQDQPHFTMTFNVTANISYFTGYIAYLNAKDLFGEEFDKISEEVKAAIPDYARTTVQNSNGALQQSAVEKLYHIQHQQIFQHLTTIAEIAPGTPNGRTVTIYGWPTTPFSHGSIHATSTNASAPATIDPQFLLHAWDVQQHVALARAIRNFAHTAPLRDVITGEVRPGLDVVPADASDDVWARWLRPAVRQSWHVVSSAPMMARELGGVVDERHLVYGTANVRVVDAAVFPFQISGHPMSVLYGLAERAADVIRDVHAG